MSKKGLIIVLSAPSGAGKTTLCDLLIKKSKNVKGSVSGTTRSPRLGEVNGKDYYFVSVKKFRKMISRGDFIEWARVHSYFYGTPRKYLERVINSGKDIALDIDVQGGLKIKRLYPNAVLIFIMAPSMKTVERRLRSRKQDTRSEIRRRLADARKEMNSLPFYDYLVINDKLDKALKEIKNILCCEHSKIRNREIPRFL